MQLDEETGELFLVWSPEKTAGARARLAAQVPPQEVARLKSDLEKINSDKEEAVRDQERELQNEIRKRQEEWWVQFPPGVLRRKNVRRIVPPSTKRTFTLRRPLSTAKPVNPVARRDRPAWRTAAHVQTARETAGRD